MKIHRKTKKMFDWIGKEIYLYSDVRLIINDETNELEMRPFAGRCWKPYAPPTRICVKDTSPRRYSQGEGAPCTQQMIPSWTSISFHLHGREETRERRVEINEKWRRENGKKKKKEREDILLDWKEGKGETERISIEARNCRLWFTRAWQPWWFALHRPTL